MDWLDYGFRMYDAQLGRFTTVDPMAEKYYSISPYAYVANNPIFNIDPTGMVLTDFFNKETGEFIAHHEDGNDQVVFVSQEDYTNAKATATVLAPFTEGVTADNLEAFQTKFVMATESTEKLDWNSDLGKTIRVTYGEMEGISNTQLDREIVAESVATRLNSGEYGNIDDILNPGQYNAAGKDIYKNGPYSGINDLKTKSPDFYSAKGNDIQKGLQQSVTASYKSLNGLSDSKLRNVVGFCSPPKDSTTHEGNPKWENVTSNFKTSGISGVWKFK